VVSGIVNNTKTAESSVVEQAPAKTKETKIIKPMGVMRPPKKEFK
jgi:hypothetical protein